jgi:hypothetical protein
MKPVYRRYFTFGGRTTQYAFYADPETAKRFHMDRSDDPVPATAAIF